MVKININDTDKKIFQTEIFNQFHPIVMRKMDALRLKSFGLENSLICQILKIHPNTLLNSRSKKWQSLFIFLRCCTFCMWFFFGLFVVHSKGFSSYFVWS